MRRAVKYCGGCNPRFDRVALVHRLEEKLRQTLPAAQPGVHYDEVYVICGCSARCAEISGIDAVSCSIIDAVDVLKDIVQ